MKHVLWMIGLLLALVANGCCAGYGEGASAFNLKLNESSPYGTDLKGRIREDRLVEIDAGWYDFKNQNVRRELFPKFYLDIQTYGASVESCSLGELVTTRSFRSIAEGKVRQDKTDCNKYHVTFESKKFAEALTSYRLIARCMVIKDRSTLRGQLKINPQPRNTFRRWLYAICPWCIPEVDSGQLEL